MSSGGGLISKLFMRAFSQRLQYCPYLSFSIACMVKRLRAIGRVFLDARRENVSPIVFLSSILKVLPLFTSISIIQGNDPFYRILIRKYMVYCLAFFYHPNPAVGTMCRIVMVFTHGV